MAEKGSAVGCGAASAAVLEEARQGGSRDGRCRSSRRQLTDMALSSSPMRNQLCIRVNRLASLTGALSQQRPVTRPHSVAPRQLTKTVSGGSVR